MPPSLHYVANPFCSPLSSILSVWLSCDLALGTGTRSTLHWVGRVMPLFDSQPPDNNSTPTKRRWGGVCSTVHLFRLEYGPCRSWPIKGMSGPRGACTCHWKGKPDPFLHIKVAESGSILNLAYIPNFLFMKPEN